MGAAVAAARKPRRLIYCRRCKRETWARKANGRNECMACGKRHLAPVVCNCGERGCEKMEIRR